MWRTYTQFPVTTLDSVAVNTWHPAHICIMC